MTIAEVVPSLLSGLEVPGADNTLDLPAARRVVLLLVDGLGHELLREHADHAPFLSGLAGRDISAGFPSSTATSLASIGTGLLSGEHGIVGYTFAVGDEVLNSLTWSRAGDQHHDLRKALVPEVVQPHPTLFERAAAAGVAVSAVAPLAHRGSGLTRAVLRGSWFRGAAGFGDLALGAVAAVGKDRSFCYAYHPDLDTIGHLYRPGSPEWLLQLEFVDALASRIASRLPAGAVLVVTADHGMVTAGERIDFDTEPALWEGVRVIAGEPRVRYLHTGSDEVLEVWREFLGDRAEVLAREDAVRAGWFGPISPLAVDRIGDVVVAMKGSAVVVRSQAEPWLSNLTGFHGSRTRRELAIPLLVHIAQ
ncbi:Predicted pyrophosphatase or phosphodiesterase, AlkP superfamily [Lentzea xinjiangensis]|uniref:Predicted pyrophosphatase or phosphodiesterase, AlkP superfamily n=1 Tax=Lentzea xinjiangensis TaxID=402600 RepID=A0A1H9P973_9PSEU|nr:alkaline phosphatase family protein [Lentzea xinjiangensis]SER44748.1 Predicted pyrophosphatase or phosphodiesterase, AlkP superfamily [Lentzea xinjiangensis]